MMTQSEGGLATIRASLAFTLQREGFLGLFRGLAPPLAGVAAQNAILFGAYGATSRYLQPHSDTPLTLTEVRDRVTVVTEPALAANGGAGAGSSSRPGLPRTAM